MELKRILALLVSRERKRGALVAVSVFVSSLLDFAGLAVLLPDLYFLLDGGIPARTALLFGLAALGLVVLKGVLSTFLTRYQEGFLMDLYRRISVSLYASYYGRGLPYIQEKGVSAMSFEINNVCLGFSQSLLSPLLKMSGEALLLLLVTVSLLVYDAVTVLILYVSFVPFLVVYVLLIRKYLRRYGMMEQEAKRNQSRVINDTFGGYTEIEVNGAFNKIEKAFFKETDDVTFARRKLGVISRIPVFLTELSVVVGLVLLTLFADGDTKVVVGIFAVAAFRLLPAMRTILKGWTELQNASFYLDIIEAGTREEVKVEEKERKAKEREEKEEERENGEDSALEVKAGKGTVPEPVAEKLPWNREISMEDVSFSYAGGGRILEHFNCKVKKGEYVGFKGYSGAGKSTLFHVLLGFLQPDEGRVLIDGEPLTGENRPLWLEHIGYVPQDVFLFDGTVAENIALGRSEIDYERVAGILEQVSLKETVEAMEQGMDTVLGENGGQLSAGQRQRMGIARALYGRVDLLLLDEATSVLDNETEREINGMLRNLRERYPELTILSISHRDDALAYCDRVVNMY